MAHEITSNDSLVLHKKRAWHGLGTVVDEDMTPTQAIGIGVGNMDWNVNQYTPFIELEDGRRIEIDTHRVNLRADTKSVLGVVSSGYQVFQNRELAEFCESLLDVSKGKVKVESAGSIRGGKKVWLLLKGEEFNVANEDLIYPYILCSNGHDSLTTTRLTPTTIRVVCSNTLHAVVPEEVGGKMHQSAISIRHTSNLSERLEEAKYALANYSQRMGEMSEMMNQLAAIEVNKEKLLRFFVDQYTQDFGEVPINPKNGHEENKKERMKSALSSFVHRFDDERVQAGTSAWNAFNAYSRLCQHEMKSRGSDDMNRVENRIHSNLFGLACERTLRAFEQAFALAQ